MWKHSFGRRYREQVDGGHCRPTAWRDGARRPRRPTPPACAARCWCCAVPRATCCRARVRRRWRRSSPTPGWHGLQGRAPGRGRQPGVDRRPGKHSWANSIGALRPLRPKRVLLTNPSRFRVMSGAARSGATGPASSTWHRRFDRVDRARTPSPSAGARSFARGIAAGGLVWAAPAITYAGPGASGGHAATVHDDARYDAAPDRVQLHVLATVDSPTGTLYYSCGTSTPARLRLSLQVRRQGRILHTPDDPSAVGSHLHANARQPAVSVKGGGTDL